MNYYITGFLKEAYYDELNKNEDLHGFLGLWSKTTKGRYIFGGDKFDEQQTKIDKWIAFHFIMHKMLNTEMGQYGIGENDFEMEMLQFAEIFYYVIYQLQHST